MDGLGPDSRGPEDQVPLPDFRDVLPQPRRERGLRPVPPHLGRAGPPVATDELAESTERQRLGKIPQRDVESPVALPREGEDRVGTRADFSIHGPPEMDPEEGKS